MRAFVSSFAYVLEADVLLGIGIFRASGVVPTTAELDLMHAGERASWSRWAGEKRSEHRQGPGPYVRNVHLSFNVLTASWVGMRFYLTVFNPIVLDGQTHPDRKAYHFPAALRGDVPAKTFLAQIAQALYEFGVLAHYTPEKLVRVRTLV